MFPYTTPLVLEGFSKESVNINNFSKEKSYVTLHLLWLSHI